MAVAYLRSTGREHLVPLILARDAFGRQGRMQGLDLSGQRELVMALLDLVTAGMR